MATNITKKQRQKQKLITTTNKNNRLNMMKYNGKKIIPP